MFDLIIKGGTVVDGTGGEPIKADVGIVGDKIAAVGDITDEQSQQIDADGKLVTPGFIDTHSHADCSVFLYPACESYVGQGITTFIGGQCGDSNAPINNYWMRKYWEYDMWNDIDPFVYDPVTVQPVDRVLRVVEEKTGYKINWKTFGEYAEVVKKSGLGCNMITLAGHSQIRADVMGLDEKRKPTKDEMNKMKSHIDEAFLSGVWGISTGRDYPPSAYADMDELLELALYAKSLGGYYFTHWKRTGVRVGTPETPNKLSGIIEALEVSLQTGIKTEISHLATGFDIYPPHGDMDRYAAEVTLSYIDDYIKRGADVAFDVIPGTSGGIRTVPYLASNFTPWLKQSGSLSQFVTNLRASDYRQRLENILETGQWYSINPKVNPLWHSRMYITKSIDASLVGQTITQIADDMRLSPVQTVLKLMIMDPKIMIRTDSKTDEEIKGLLKHDRGSVCTDTYAFDLKGLYGNDSEIAEILPHPHTYCAFPKYILKYHMDTIQATIRKITGAPAEFMGIDRRGVIREGNFADIVVLDMNRLKTNENYIEPRVYPEGIDYVFINGRKAVDNGVHTGEKAGILLTK